MSVERFDSEPSTRNRHRIVPAASPRRTRVAVADDDKAIRDLVAAVLSEEGYDVRTASDGRELLDLVASFEPDVVLTDLSMPRMSGIDVLRTLRERRSPVRVVLMPGWPSWKDERDLSGASALLHKPFDIGELLEAVNRP